jgi:UDP-N-acetylmuramate--alanine ligase
MGFWSDFVDSLRIADHSVLLDIYPAREEPIPGVTSELIYDNLAPQVQKQLIHKEEVLALVESKKAELEVLVTLGAGDIENYAQAITQILNP